MTEPDYDAAESLFMSLGPNRDEIVDAVDSLINMSRAISVGNLSINDIVNGLRIAVESGEDMICIAASMASHAAGMLGEERERDRPEESSD